jgi:hypothetical protein
MFNTNIGGLVTPFFNVENLDIQNASIAFLDAGEIDATILNATTFNINHLNLSEITGTKATITNISNTNLSTNKITSSTINNAGTLNSSFGNIGSLSADTFNANSLQSAAIFSDGITVFGDVNATTVTANNLSTASMTAGTNISILNNVISAVSTIPPDLVITGVPAETSAPVRNYQKYIELFGFKKVFLGKDITGNNFEISTMGGGPPDPDVHLSLRRPGAAFETVITGTLECTGNVSAPNLTSTNLTFVSPLVRTTNAISVNNTNLVQAGNNALVTSAGVHTAIQSATSASNSNIIQTKLFQGTASPISDFSCDGGVTVVNSTINPGTTTPVECFYVDFTPKFQGSFINVNCQYSYAISGNNQDTITFDLVSLTNNNTFLQDLDQKRQHWNNGGGGGSRSCCGGSQAGNYVNNDTVGKFHRIKLRVINSTNESDDAFTLNNTKTISVTVTEVIQALAQTNLSMSNLSASNITATYLNASLIRINDNQHPAELQGSTDNHAIVFREDVEGTAFREISYFRFLNGGLRATQTEKMRIEQNGNVGIGTDNPTEKLHINGNLRLTGNVSCENLSTMNVSCDIITATNLNTANLIAGENISILNNSISAFLNLSNISVTNVSCRSIGSATNQPFFIKHGVVSCLTVATNNDVTISNNLNVLGDTEIQGDLDVGGIANFNIVNASNLSTATMAIGTGLKLENNTLSLFGSFTGTDITCLDLTADANVSVNGTLKVADVANFNANVNMSDILYIGDPGVKSGRIVLYDQVIGNTMKMFYEDGKAIVDIEATSINYTKDNISKIEIADDFNVYSDMNVFGKIIATDGIDLTNLSEITVGILNASTLNVSSQNINVTEFNAGVLNCSTNNASVINAPLINVSNLINTTLTSNTINTPQMNVSNISINTSATFNTMSGNSLTSFNINSSGTIAGNTITGTNCIVGRLECDDFAINVPMNVSKINASNLSVNGLATITNLSNTLATITNLSNTNITSSNQLTVNKQTNSGLAIFNDLVEMTHLVTITDLNVIGSFIADHEGSFNSLNVNTSIVCNALKANTVVNTIKVNVSNLSVDQTITANTIRNTTINTSKINVSNLSINVSANFNTMAGNSLTSFNINSNGTINGNTISATTCVVTLLECDDFLINFPMNISKINVSNLSVNTSLTFNTMKGNYIESADAFFDRIETDDLVLNNLVEINALNVSILNASQINISNINTSLNVSGSITSNSNISGKNVFATSGVTTPLVNGTTLITGPYISGALIEGTTSVDVGINGINNGIVKLNGQASQTSTNQWVNVSTFRSTYTRTTASEPTNYIVRIGNDDRMIIGNASTRFLSNLQINNNNIIGSRFRCLKLVNNVSNRFPNNGSPNTTTLVASLIVNGGTLQFHFECGGLALSVTTMNYLFELRNSTNTTTIKSTVAIFSFHEILENQYWARMDVYTGVPSGEYLLRVTRSSVNLIHDLGDFFNVTMTEFPF